MIFIAGMKGGSGAGLAASRKAGWAGVEGATGPQPAGRSAANRSLYPPHQSLSAGRAASPPRSAVGPDGRPLPPDGSPPPIRRRAAAASASRIGSVPALTRATPSPVQPGHAPSAPPGHTFTARPSKAPPGEFVFDLRCSCGASTRVPVTRSDLRAVADRGLPASQAIAIATQHALDAMHR
jgi:hypothetical protein